LAKVAVVGALLIAAGFLALRFVERVPGSDVDTRDQVATTSTDGPARTTAPSPETTAAERAAEQAASAEPAPEPHRLTMTLKSDPPGARVVIDGKAYGQTPADIEWWGEQAQPGREITFVFRKDGYEKVTVVRTINEEQLSVDVSLPQTVVHRRPTAPARRPSSALPQNEPTQPTVPVVVPDDFKDDPY
jgi:hypothetical protein